MNGSPVKKALLANTVPVNVVVSEIQGGLRRMSSFAVFCGLNNTRVDGHYIHAALFSGERNGNFVALKTVCQN